jgi:16S rRNA (guanine527-N7)-methyltransferase
MKEVKKNYVKLSMMVHCIKENRDLLNSGAHLLGVHLDTTMVEAFERFLDELRKWNQRMNLTALRDERAIIVRHFLDSLTLVEYLPQAASLLDIGAGAGFPGVPLKIARPDLQVVLLEAGRKKTHFHKHVIRSLSLSGIRSIWGRSDQGEVKAILGDRFDIVVSRAVSPLERFLQGGIHFVHTGGTIVAMRGRDVRVPALTESLGLTLYRTVSVDLPFDRIRRHLLFFKKRGRP